AGLTCEKLGLADSSNRAPLKVPGVVSARLSAMVLDSALTMVSLNQPSWLIAIGRLLSQDDVDVLALAALGIGAFGHLVAELVGHGLEPLPRRVAALGHLVAGGPGPAARPDLDALTAHVLAERLTTIGVPRHGYTASDQGLKGQRGRALDSQYSSCAICCGDCSGVAWNSSMCSIDPSPPWAAAWTDCHCRSVKIGSGFPVPLNTRLCPVGRKPPESYSVGGTPTT